MYADNRIIKQIDKISGREFELYTGYLMELLSFKDVIVTRATGDFGIDVIGTKNGKRIGIQCKNFISNCVGYHAVEETCGGCKYYGLDHGIVLTNSYFSNPAIHGAKRCNVGLIDRKGIINLTNYLLNRVTVKNPSSNVLDQMLKVSNKNTKKKNMINGKRFKAVVSRLKHTQNPNQAIRNRRVLNKVVKKIKHEKQDIIKIAKRDAKNIKERTKYLNYREHKQDVIQNKNIYHALAYSSSVTNTLFPNPSRVNYDISLKELISYLNQAIINLDHHNTKQAITDYRNCYHSREIIGIIRNRIKSLDYYIRAVNDYYTTRRTIRSITRGNHLMIRLSRLINDPVLIKLYNCHFHTNHTCGSKRDKFKIFTEYNFGKHTKEFARTRKIIKHKEYKTAVSIAKAKARGTKSMVNFLPITAKDLMIID